MKCNQNMVRFHSIFFEFSESLREWNACFKSKTDNTSHLELPNIKMYPLKVDKLFFAILTFKCLNLLQLSHP